MMTSNSTIYQVPQPDISNQWLTMHVSLLRSSLKRLTGRDLVDATVSDMDAARQIFFAPFVVLSHNTCEDPIFNYANQTAMELFEMSWDEITNLPSRKSAQAPNREERQRLLTQVAQKGYIDNYAGIRISKSGKRFVIEQATVWNLIDENGDYHGQAATFSSWKFLTDI